MIRQIFLINKSQFNKDPILINIIKISKLLNYNICLIKEIIKLKVIIIYSPCIVDQAINIIKEIILHNNCCINNNNIMKILLYRISFKLSIHLAIFNTIKTLNFKHLNN